MVSLTCDINDKNLINDYLAYKIHLTFYNIQEEGVGCGAGMVIMGYESLEAETEVTNCYRP